MAALKGNSIQAADIFSTDPGIGKNKFVVLQDPKNLFGFENVTPLTYKSALPAAGFRPSMTSRRSSTRKPS